MKVLVATKETQGKRKSDFCWCEEGELLVFAMVCDRDAMNPDPDGGCGCGRSLSGMISHRATTTFKVEDRPITGQEFTDLYIGAMQDAGWISPSIKHEKKPLGGICICADCARRDFASDAAEMLRLASKFQVGDVLEKRKDTFKVRSRIKTIKPLLAIAASNMRTQHEN